MVCSSRIDKPITVISWKAMASYEGMGWARGIIVRGGGVGGEFLSFGILFPKLVCDLLKVAIIAAMSLAGTIPALKVSGITGTLFILLSMAILGLAVFIFTVFLGYGKGP